VNAGQYVCELLGSIFLSACSVWGCVHSFLGHYPSMVCSEFPWNRECYRIL